MLSFLIVFLVFGNNAWAEKSNIRHIPVIAANQTGSTLAYTYRPFYEDKNIQISFSRTYMDARPLVIVDPILSVEDSEIETDIYKCLEKQVDVLTSIFQDPRFNYSSPKNIFVGIKQFDGMLLESLCRPASTLISENVLILQICYASKSLSNAPKCELPSKDIIGFSYSSFAADRSKKIETVNSLKNKAANLVNILKDRAK